MKNSFPRRSALYSFAIIILYGNSFSQNWRSYSVTNGLSNNSISAVVEDDHGKIWVGTDGGLNRFDGREWIHYRRSNGDFLVHDSITDILKDREGKLWIGTWNGMSKIDPENDLKNPMKWKNYNRTNTKGGLIGNLIIAMEEDDEGNIWIGIHDQGVSIVNPAPLTNQDPLLNLDDWRIVRSDSQLINVFGTLFVYDIEKDGLGNIWVATNGGASRYNHQIHDIHGKWDLFPELGDVRSIFADSHGFVWFGRFGEGVTRVRAENIADRKEFLPARNTQIIGEDADGKIWFGTAGTASGIFVVDPYDLDNWFEFNQENGLAANVINSIFQDSEGDMWIGTGEKGISRLDISWINFSGFVRDFQLRFTNVTTMAEDNANNLWLGTDDDGLRIVNLKANLFVEQNWPALEKGEKALASDFINVIFKDDTGFFWIGTRATRTENFDGLNLVDPLSDLSLTKNWLTFTVENTDSGLTNNTVNAIAQDRGRYMWFGTEDGLSRVHRDSVTEGSSWTSFNSLNGLNSNVINFILIDRLNFLWIGTTKGLNRIKLSGDLESDWEDIELFAGKEILTIFEDLEGRLWIGTSRNGVYIFDPNHDPHKAINWMKFTFEDGLASNAVNSITQSRPNEFWLATNGGVTRLQAMAGQIDSVWTVFTAEDGPKDIIINTIFRDSQENLWFGTASSGVTRHRTKINEPDTFIEPKLDVTTADNIIIKYSGADLNTPPDQLRFSYQIDNLGWQPFAQSESVQLFNLATGRHLFEVRAMDLDGNIDPRPDCDVFYKFDPDFGGRIEVSDSTTSATLYFPPGELAKEKEVTITKIQNYELADPKAIVAYEIKPISLLLNKPATLSISFLDSRDFDPNQVAIFSQKADSGWIGIGGTKKSMNNKLTITTAITEFGRYAVRREKAEPDIMGGQVNIQPRVFSPAAGDRGYGDRTSISFPLKKESMVTIKIYNLSGRLVCALCENRSMNPGRNVIEWDGRDLHHIICPSGLYIVTIEAAGSQATKQVVVMNE